MCTYEKNIIKIRGKKIVNAPILINLFSHTFKMILRKKNPKIYIFFKFFVMVIFFFFIFHESSETYSDPALSKIGIKVNISFRFPRNLKLILCYTKKYVSYVSFRTKNLIWPPILRGGGLNVVN